MGILVLGYLNLPCTVRTFGLLNIGLTIKDRSCEQSLNVLLSDYL